MKKILFLSKGEKPVSTRYRALSYFSTLQENGWSVAHMGLHEGLAGKIAILQAARSSDVVVLLRHGLVFPFLPLLRKCSRKLVFDFDDAVFLKSSGRPSTVRAKRFDRTVALCDRIWAGNHYLAERVKNITSKTIVLPTSVDLSRYQIQAQKAADTIDPVWIGSSSTRKYLEAILPVLEQAALNVPRLRLKIIADFSLQSEVLEIVAVPWHSDTEVRELKNAHIGIAPMPDDSWTRGKCALKILQYMASRLPVVSSKVGANSEVVHCGKTGFLADTEQEWIESISSLAKSSSLREQMGETGYALCQQHYSQEACVKIMMAQLDALNS